MIEAFGGFTGGQDIIDKVANDDVSEVVMQEIDVLADQLHDLIAAHPDTALGQVTNESIAALKARFDVAVETALNGLRPGTEMYNRVHGIEQEIDGLVDREYPGGLEVPAAEHARIRKLPEA